MIGKIFGKLTVLSKLGDIKGTQSIYWECKCICGKITKARTAYLVNGRKSSCGCIRVEKSRASIQKLIGWNKLPEGVAAFNIYYNQYSSGIKKRNLPFELSKRDFFEITQKNCSYCGSPPNTPHGHFKLNGDSKLNGPYISNGIDRVDSSKGYTLANSVPCCKTCNLMKHELSIDNFLKHIELLYNNINKIKEIKC
jgi:5-methylcytosine-specific restriction endonuclease McrA